MALCDLVGVGASTVVHIASSVDPAVGVGNPGVFTDVTFFVPPNSH